MTEQNDHGPECSREHVHVLSTHRDRGQPPPEVGDPIRGECLGCKRVVDGGRKRQHGPITCPSCREAHLASYRPDERAVYDTEIIYVPPTDSRQGTRLHGWGRW